MINKKKPTKGSKARKNARIVKSDTKKIKRAMNSSTNKGNRIMGRLQKKTAKRAKK